MTKNTPSINGFYEFNALPPVNTNKLDEFTIGDWAGLSELFVQKDDGKHTFPHIADYLSGYLPNWGVTEVEYTYKKHPLEDVQTALGQMTHNNFQALRLLSFQVGQIVDPERSGSAIYGWERQSVDEQYIKLPIRTFNEKPTKKWDKARFQEFYLNVRETESKKLIEDVKKVAGAIAIQNDAEQLYVAKTIAKYGESNGWLAPLLGLCVDPTINPYRDQVHEVVAVVRQTDGVVAHMKGVTGNLYTAYAPREGVR